MPSKIKELRMASHMTQEQLAERLYVSRDLVSKWETGERRPDRDALKALASLFSVPVEDVEEQKEDVLKELLECCLPEREFSNYALETALNGFLASLKQKERVAFILRYYMVKEEDAICTELGVSKNNLRVILHRTRKKLKKYLSEVQDGQQTVI